MLQKRLILLLLILLWIAYRFSLDNIPTSTSRLSAVSPRVGTTSDKTYESRLPLNNRLSVGKIRFVWYSNSKKSSSLG